MVNKALGPPGHGAPLWFEVDSFAQSVQCALGLGAEVLEGPMFNPGPQHWELWLRDLDGYVVVVCSADCTPDAYT